MDRQIPFGMVGGAGGFIGDVHRTAAGMDLRCRLTAGCFSRNPAANRQAGERFSIAPDRLYSSYEEMARREGDREDGIRFVSIVAPNAVHYGAAKAFLKADIHVLCEKPLCYSLEEALELQELARSRGLLFGLAHAYTGYPMVRLARELVSRGDLGEIFQVQGEYVQEWMLPRLTPSGEKAEAGEGQAARTWRRETPEPGVPFLSSCVGDIGVHLENMIAYVTGLPIRRLSARLDRLGQPLEVNGNILVEYENGGTGSYWCSQVAAGYRNGLSFRLFGAKGSLEWRQESPESLLVCIAGEAARTCYRGSQPSSGAGAVRLPGGHPEGFYEAFANLYRGFLDALAPLLQGMPPSEIPTDFPTIREGVRDVRFIRAALESSCGDGQWILM